MIIEEEIEISQELYDLVGAVKEEDESEEHFIEGALRWYLKQIDDPEF